jgi:hypothetical protein
MKSTEAPWIDGSELSLQYLSNVHYRTGEPHKMFTPNSSLFLVCWHLTPMYRIFFTYNPLPYISLTLTNHTREVMTGQKHQIWTSLRTGHLIIEINHSFIHTSGHRFFISWLRLGTLKPVTTSQINFTMLNYYFWKGLTVLLPDSKLLKFY